MLPPSSLAADAATRPTSAADAAAKTLPGLCDADFETVDVEYAANSGTAGDRRAAAAAVWTEVLVASRRSIVVREKPKANCDEREVCD